MSIKRLAFITLLLTYFLIVFGGYVASSESGMGCGPEWPLCNGDVIPTLKGDTLIEFSHRVIGAVLGIIAVVLFVKIVKENQDRTVRRVAYSMITLLAIQIIFGAIVVVLDLPAIIVTAHLLVAMLFFACLIWLWRIPDTKDSKKNHTPNIPLNHHTKIKKHLNISLLLLIFTLGFGAYVKHQSYGGACDWLDCRDSFFPSNKAQLFQTLHRIIGIVTTFYILLISYWSFIKGWGAAIQKRLVYASFTALIQVAIGIVTILANIELSWAVIHLAVGTALFAIVIESRVILSFNKASTFKIDNSHNNRQNFL